MVTVIYVKAPNIKRPSPPKTLDTTLDTKIGYIEGIVSIKIAETRRTLRNKILDFEDYNVDK